MHSSSASRSPLRSGIWPVPRSLAQDPARILAVALEGSALLPTPEERARVLRGVRKKILRHERLAFGLRLVGLTVLILALALLQANG